MKINWGTGIVLAFVAFMSFILYFVITLTTNKKYDHHLVTDDYYKQELAFQNEIDAENNVRMLSEPVRVERNNDGISIQLPKEFDNKKLKGTISLYRPSNKHLDFSLPIDAKASTTLISGKRLLEGRWDIRVTWEENGTSYLFRKSIMY